MLSRGVLSRNKMDEAALRQMSREAYEQGNFDLATSYYRQILEIRPYDYENIIKLGSVLILQSNFVTAVQVYGDAITKLETQNEKGKALGTMHVRLAEAYVSLHRLEEAQAQLEIAGRSGADPPVVSEARGRIHNIKGEYDKALAAYQEYIHFAPNENYGYLGIADAYKGLKRYDLALDSLKSAKAITPNDYWVEIALGNLAMVVENYGTALSHYKSAQVLDPRKPAVIFSMGRAYLMMKDYVNARKMFSLALERRPNSAHSMHGLAQVEIADGNTRQAIALLKSAILLNPANRSYYALLIQTQMTSGKVLDAWRTSFQARKRFVNQKA